ncbi:hypothetical protein ACFYWS_13235 [Streptomyces sp. NPDC002795]|uniref:hypothetical protein n=1 Tax=Streptomyces sp. NPDC002795 TaxID=3364665 RepID=UPI003694AE41
MSIGASTWAHGSPPGRASLSVAAVSEVGAQLASHPRVRVVTLRNDTGGWNAEPDAYPDGLYLGVECRSSAGAVWNLDLWFLTDPERQPPTAHLTTLLPCHA